MLPRALLQAGLLQAGLLRTVLQACLLRTVLQACLLQAVLPQAGLRQGLQAVLHPVRSGLPGPVRRSLCGPVRPGMRFLRVRPDLQLLRLPQAYPQHLPHDRRLV